MTFYFDNINDIVKGSLFLMLISTVIRVVVVCRVLKHRYYPHLLLGIEAGFLYISIYFITKFSSQFVDFEFLLFPAHISHALNIAITSFVAIVPTLLYFMLSSPMILNRK